MEVFVTMFVKDGVPDIKTTRLFFECDDLFRFIDVNYDEVFDCYRDFDGDDSVIYDSLTYSLATV